MEHDIDIDIDRASPTLDEALDGARVSVTRFPPASSWIHTEVLERSGLPKGSLLGTLLRRSDGMLLDRRWIRMLGVTDQACGRNLQTWNDPAGWRSRWGEEAEGMLCFADDPAGNQFAINIGKEGDGNWQVFLGWIPDRKWKPLDVTFGQWFEAALQGKHVDWYPADLWKIWQGLLETKRVDPDECWVVEPPLSEGGAWSDESVSCAKAVDAVARDPV